VVGWDDNFKNSSIMSKSFIHDQFLLKNKYAQELYHNYAAHQPIIDYHNHLPPKEIAENRVFENISQVWLAGDHYKWRAMRSLGVDEKFITGTASDKEKFIAWAKSVPATVRNPLYHWTHLELKRYFGVDVLLNEKNASEIYDEINQKLQTPAFSCLGLLEQRNVEIVCTTEDPTDTLVHHQNYAKTHPKIKMSTAFRPDKAIFIENEEYNVYLDRLAASAEMEISTFQNLKDALYKRMDYFHENGCRLCDHGLNYVPFTEATESEIEKIFEKRRAGKQVSKEEQEKFQTSILLFLGETYHEFKWVQQFHLGALRNNNERMLNLLGPDTGWDSIGDFQQASALSKFLNALDKKDKLTKTILYNLNPADNEVLATMIGNFNDGKIKGKMQFGSGWWFLDQKDGIVKQLNALSNMGMLSSFIGMLTDSRSFLSFPRHEYFRRILCNIFGEEMESGELPADLEMMGKIISDISYHNAKNYFDF
jgi:glucuronate isomerase